MRYKSLIKLAIICFIIYAIYASNSHLLKKWADKASYNLSTLRSPTDNNTEIPEQSKKNKEDLVQFKISSKNEDSVIGNIAASTINKILENPQGRAVFEGVVNNMVINYHGALGQDILNTEFIIKDIEFGSGDQLKCGGIAEIEYSVVESAKEKAEVKSLSEKTKKSLIIGEGKINKLIENGIIGMKKGGTRKVIYGKPNDSKFIIAEVSLLDFKSEKTTKLPSKIFIEKTNYPGQIFGPKIMCGDTLDVNYSISNLKGNILFDSRKENKKIRLQIGKKPTPNVLSDGLLGLTKSKTKIALIATPKDLQYTDPLNQNLIPQDLNIPNDELLLLEIDTNA